MVSEVVTREGVTIHAPQQFYAGDTWEIEALCENCERRPMNLSGAVLTWKLDDATGLLVNYLTLTNTVSGGGILLEVPTSGDNPTGLALITVTAGQSALLLPGYYRDELTVVVDNIISTIWQGRILVLPKLF